MNRCHLCNGVEQNLMKLCYCSQSKHFVHSSCLDQLVYRTASRVCPNVDKTQIEIDPSYSKSWLWNRVLFVWWTGLTIWSIVSPFLTFYSNIKEIYLNGLTKLLEIFVKTKFEVNDMWALLSQLLLPVLFILSAIRSLEILWTDYKMWKNISHSVTFRRNE